MDRYIYILKRIVYGFLVLTQTIHAQSPGSSQQSSSQKDTISDESAHSLFAGGGYGSNMIYLGSTISQDQPYEYASVAYGFKNEFFISCSAIHLNGKTPFSAFYTGAITYSHTFNNWFDLSAGLYRYQVAESLTDTLFNSFTYSDLTLGFDWKILYSKISAGGLFSDGSKIYLQLRNSRYFQTPDFARGKANISFDPYFNLLFGNLTTLESEGTTTYYYSVPSNSRKWGQPVVSQGESAYSDKFSLLEFDFGLPITLNTGKFSLEAEPSYLFTFMDDAVYPGIKGFNFSLSLFFRLF